MAENLIKQDIPTYLSEQNQSADDSELYFSEHIHITNISHIPHIPHIYISVINVYVHLAKTGKVQAGIFPCGTTVSH